MEPAPRLPGLMDVGARAGFCLWAKMRTLGPLGLGSQILGGVVASGPGSLTAGLFTEDGAGAAHQQDVEVGDVEELWGWNGCSRFSPPVHSRRTAKPEVTVSAEPIGEPDRAIRPLRSLESLIVSFSAYCVRRTSGCPRTA